MNQRARAAHKLADMYAGWAKRYRSQLSNLVVTSGKSLDEWVAAASKHNSPRRASMFLAETVHVMLLAQHWIKSFDWLAEQVKAEIPQQSSHQRSRRRHVPVFGSEAGNYLAIHLATRAATCMEELRHRLAESQRADALNKCRHDKNRNAKKLVCSEWIRRRNDFRSAEQAGKFLASWLEGQGFRYEDRTVTDWIRVEAKKKHIRLR